MCHNLNTLLVVAVLLSCNWSFAQDTANKPSGEILQQPKSQIWDTPAESEIKEAKTVPFPFEKQEQPISPAQPQPTLSQPASLQPTPAPSKPVVIPEIPAVPVVTTPDEITPEQIEVTPQSSPFTVPRVGKHEPENTAENASETANDNPDAKTTETDSVPETTAEPTGKAKGSGGDSLDSDYNYKRMLSQKPEPQLKPRYSRYGYPTYEASDTPLDPCSPPERLLRMFPTYRMVDGRYEYVTRGGLLSTSVRGKLSPYFIDGWISQGTTLNFHWPKGENNSPIRYNDVASEYVLNQVYVTLGRQVHKNDKWDWGFRADLLYGSDYLYTSSIGLETHRYYTLGGERRNAYDPSNADLHWNSNEGPRRDPLFHQASMYGLSMPQLYAELYAPSGTTVRVGHFYSNMGIESPMSPYNFFYSHSYSFMYGMPTTFTGGTVTQQLTKQLRIMGGLTQGWDIWESPNKSIGWLGGVEWYSASRNSRLAFNLSSARQSDRDDYNTTYSLLFSHRLTKQLTYSIEHTLGYEENASVYDSVTEEERIGRQFSITQYLTWQMSESLGIGLRGEWFRDDGHARILRYPINDGNINVTGNDYFGLSLGLNWRPLSCVAIRPEVRYDWSDVRVNNTVNGTSSGIYNNQSKGEQVTFSVDATVRF